MPRFFVKTEQVEDGKINIFGDDCWSMLGLVAVMPLVKNQILVITMASNYGIGLEVITPILH